MAEQAARDELLEDLLNRIAQSPRKPTVAALFDFDGTIMDGYSASEFTKAQLRQRKVSGKQLLGMGSSLLDMVTGQATMVDMMEAGIGLLEGQSEADYQTLGQAVWEKQIALRIYPEVRALIRAHQQAGHTVAIVSSATLYQLQPAAEDLRIEHILCTRPAVRDGRFTGKVNGPQCYGKGKVHYARQLAKSHRLNLKQSFFYSDSHEDLPLLKAVGKPCALNPNRKLKRIAERQTWPAVEFAPRARPGALQTVRSLAADLSLIPSLLAAVPVWGLTGRRNAARFAGMVYGEMGAALIGLKLKVIGEGNIWSHRPCIFLFNHQSKADGVIMSRLMRGDIAGVAKKEVAPIPLFARMMELGGTVLIDRKDGSSAIEAMAGLVDEMNEHGRSVMMAPEGTRSTSAALGAFKKGAFHLAIQAGVPVVPVVIHNARDIAPRGALVYRPGTVNVEVLAPVATDGWRVETLDEHVAAVRGLFLKALGQTESPSKASVKPRRKTRGKKRSTKKTTRKPPTGSKLSRAANAASKPARKKRASRAAGRNPGRG